MVDMQYFNVVCDSIKNLIRISDERRHVDRIPIGDDRRALRPTFNTAQSEFQATFKSSDGAWIVRREK